MNARNKLNRIVVVGCFVAASLVGGLTNSWPAFVATLVIGITLAIQDGDIRAARHRHHHG